MQSLVQLRMMNHEKTMRQMVEEIHRGKLNIDQAAAKFETTRKTVQHWIELVEEEGQIAKRLAQEDILLPLLKKKASAKQASQPDQAKQVEELKVKISALEEQLQTANRDGGPFQSPVLFDLGAGSGAGVGHRHRKKVRYQVIRTMLMNNPHVSIRQLEGVLGFSRQAYYQYWQRQAGQTSAETTVIDLVKVIRKDHPQMGTRKLYDLLKEQMDQQGIKLGRDALFELLAANGLLIRKRRRRVRTTFSCHRFRKYPNLIRELVLERPNQLWVADITYWFTHYGCLYISLVTDAYSKRIMGYGVAETLQAVHCKAALQVALEQIDPKAGKSLIHHSDRGLQYCSAEYISLLESYHVQISMTENGDPLENAVAERINGVIKNEYLACSQFVSASSVGAPAGGVPLQLQASSFELRYAGAQSGAQRGGQTETAVAELLLQEVAGEGAGQ